MSEPGGATDAVEVNGQLVAVGDAPLHVVLGGFLRDHAGCREVKLACLEGACGSCAVLLDGAPVPSCLVHLGRAVGRRVTTVAGLVGDPIARAVVDALLARGALQCGYCTPGWVCAAVAALRGPVAQGTGDRAAAGGGGPLARSREEVRRELASVLGGHLCRCTGYRTILDALVDAAFATAGTAGVVPG